MVLYSHPLYPGARISQPFGANPNNGNNGPGGHNGDDYAVPHGTPVKAVADGVVEFEGWVTGDYRNNPWWFTPGAGIVVILDHGNGNPDSAYSHLSRTTVSKGQTVKRGQVIGYVGSTGNSSGPHLHFSMFPPNYDLTSPTYGTVNPSIYLNPATVKESTVNPVIEYLRKIALTGWTHKGVPHPGFMLTLEETQRRVDELTKTVNKMADKLGVDK